MGVEGCGPEDLFKKGCGAVFSFVQEHWTYLQDIFSYIVTIILAVSWALFGKKIECTGTEIYQDIVSSIENCAGICSRLATMFLYGTNSETCTDEGCKCWCETSAGYEGTCTTKSNSNFNLYRFESLYANSLNFPPGDSKTAWISIWRFESRYEHSLDSNLDIRKQLYFVSWDSNPYTKTA